MTQPTPSAHVDVHALARELVPLLVPALVDALTRAGAIGATPYRVPRPPPPPPPPRRFWTAKEAADWSACPDGRIVWDEQAGVVPLHEMLVGHRYWEIVGYNEQRTKAWLQLMPYEKWLPEHSLFGLVQREGKQPDPYADPERFRRWQEWLVRNPASEYGPVYPWSKRKQKRKGRAT